MTVEQARHFCIQFDPASEVTLLLALSDRGTITADKCRTVLWAELFAVTARELERLPGVVKVIEYTQPLWSDVLGEEGPRPLTADAKR